MFRTKQPHFYNLWTLLGILLLSNICQQGVYAQYIVKDIHLINEAKVKTQKDIIFRELSFKEGDTLIVNDWDSIISWNENRVFNLQLFNSVHIEVDTQAQQAAFTIKVQERLPIWVDPKFTLGDRNFNVWAKEHNYDLKRVNIGARITHLNLLGRRIQTSLTVQGGYTQRFGMELLVPFIDKSKKHGIGASAFRSTNKEVAVNTKENKLIFYTDFGSLQYQEWSADVFYTYRPAYAWQYKIGLRLLDHRIDDTIRNLNADFLGDARSRLTLLQPFARVEFNGVDNWNYPLKGWRMIVHGKLSTGLNTKFHYSALHTQIDYYKKLHHKWYMSADWKMKWTYQSDYTYLFNRNLGYDNDFIRGYEYYVIDGHFMSFLRLDLKYELINKKIKLPIRYLETIPIRFYPKLFGDIGYSANRWNPTGLNHRMLFSVGVGLDIVTLYDIKVRLEFAYNHLKESDLYIHRQGN